MSTDNSADSSNKISDLHTDLASLPFAALATANYTGDFNFAFPKETPLDAVISISNMFITIFDIFTSITLEKKPKLYKFNLFSFAANYQ